MMIVRRRREAERRAASNGQRERGRLVPVTVGLAAAGVLVAVALVIAATRGSGPLTTNERVQEIASGLRCVMCQNLSVADSPSDTAQAMRDEIGDRLRDGQTPGEIRAYLVGRYGQWILLSPPASGFSLIPWVAPPLALAVGGVALVWTLRRKRPARVPSEARASSAERARIRQELAMLEEPD
jgi:cytochrome c-type biogenesis protein CcmH